MATEQSSFWTELHFKMAAVGGGAVLFVALLVGTFRYELTLPDKPPRPKVTAVSAERFSAGVDRNPKIWENYLERDARTFGVEPPSVDEMKAPFRYRVDDKGYLLEPGTDHNAVETAGLRLTVSTRDIARGLRYDKQMVLSIENPGDKALAYKVETRPSRGTKACQQKDDLAHNAIAVAAGAAELRSECVYRSGWKLKIVQVETMELPELAYHYVSQLSPPQVGYERRVARGHKPPGGRGCQVVLGADVARGIESGAIPWRDLIDFYARHRCQTYTFPSTYKAIERAGQIELPAAGARR